MKNFDIFHIDLKNNQGKLKEIKKNLSQLNEEKIK